MEIGPNSQWTRPSFQTRTSISPRTTRNLASVDRSPSSPVHPAIFGLRFLSEPFLFSERGERPRDSTRNFPAPRAGTAAAMVAGAYSIGAHPHRKSRPEKPDIARRFLSSPNNCSRFSPFAARAPDRPPEPALPVQLSAARTSVSRPPLADRLIGIVTFTDSPPLRVLLRLCLPLRVKSRGWSEHP